jgi:MarR family transcriptional regulator, organic hydroperoxide resistance regulator
MAKGNFSFSSAEESTGFLLWQVTNLWQREIKKALEKYDLTHAQFVSLASIYWFSINKQEVTQVVLSNYTKIDPMTTSTLLRTMLVKKLIKREQHETDTRAKVVVLTEHGLKVTKQAIKVVEAFDKKFFGTLGREATDFNAKLLGLIAD